MMTPDLRQQHDQYRSRLDMYCVLVFVSAFLAAIGPVLLITGQSDRPGAAVGVGLSFFVLALASYKAALLSAGHYAGVLRSIDIAVGQAKAAEKTGPSYSSAAS